jgi:toxin CptA
VNRKLNSSSGYANMHAGDFQLKPSRQYLFLFAAIVFVSVLILGGLPIPLWLKLIANLVVISHSSRVCWRYVLLRDKLAITSIRHTEEKRWVVQNREGAFAVELQGGSTVTNFVMLLHFRIPGKMLPLKSIIFRDSLPQDDFRKLLVLLNA